MLGMRSDFGVDSGAGVPRYMFEMYNRIRNERGLSVEKVMFRRLPVIGNGISFRIISSFKNLNKYDIIHNLEELPFYPLKKGRYTSVATAHDFGLLLYPNELIPAALPIRHAAWLELVVKPGLKSALSSDYIFANSTQTREEAVKLGFERKRIFLIALGVDDRYVRQVGKSRNKDIFKIGYIGAMRYNKNIKFAVKGINLIKDPKIEFEIWGKKEFEYVNLTQEVKNKNIKFMGFAPENKIVDVYDSFDAFTFPSLYEGFGLPIFEAMARGLPVIIYRYGKIPKEVRKYCFEAESPENMAQIIEDLKENGYNEKLKKKATEYARSFTWEKTARETLKVYKKVIN